MLVGRAPHTPSRSDEQGELTCQLLPTTDVDDELGSGWAALLAVQFSHQLQRRELDFRRHTEDPFIVALLDEVPAHFAIDLQAAFLEA